MESPVTRLEALPVELLELTCKFLVDSDPFVRDVRLLHSLRMTCRELNQKTFRYFASAAFRKLHVHMSSTGLRRLADVSTWPTLADKVESLRLAQYDVRNLTESQLRDTREKAGYAPLFEKDRFEASRELCGVYKEQDDKDFLERSGTDVLTLATAFANLPNLRSITIECSLPEHALVSSQLRHLGCGHSDTRLFSIVTSCLAYATKMPESLQLEMRERFSWKAAEGVSLQALHMPGFVIHCFSELRVLRLVLHVDDIRYRNPKEWYSYLGHFLKHCPRLLDLDLVFHRAWRFTEPVLGYIAKDVVLPDLTGLHLQGVRCRGSDLRLFLGNHKDLQSLVLKDMDITGSVTFVEVLRVLQEDPCYLSFLQCCQIAQRSYWLCLAPCDAQTRQVESPYVVTYVIDIDPPEDAEDAIRLLEESVHVTTQRYDEGVNAPVNHMIVNGDLSILWDSD